MDTTKALRHLLKLSSRLIFMLSHVVAICTLGATFYLGVGSCTLAQGREPTNSGSLSSETLDKTASSRSLRTKKLDIQAFSKRVMVHLQEFVREPHPAGSEAQKKYTEVLAQHLQQQGWSVERTPVTVPSVTPLRDPLVKPKPQDMVIFNVIATRKGREPCSIMLGGHSDTKFFADFRFIGANDGGSSTALLLALAELPVFKTEPPAGSWLACTVHLVFFDGEEAILPNWYDGERLLGIVDHLYGSRILADQVTCKNSECFFRGQSLEWVMILDMIGHKNQSLMITKGSDEALARKLLDINKFFKLNLKMYPDIMVDDDHTPFMNKGVRVIHIIDFINTKEWHTPYDTLQIVDAKKIAEFANVLLYFLQSEKHR